MGLSTAGLPALAAVYAGGSVVLAALATVLIYLAVCGRRSRSQAEATDAAVEEDPWVPPPIPPRGESRGKVPSMFSRLDRAQINADIYKRQDSDRREGDPVGTAHLTLFYNTHFNLLTTTVVEVRGLVPRDATTTPDPCLQAAILPDGQASRVTDPRPATLDPRFDEEFCWELPREGLTSRTLELVVWDALPHSTRLCLGVGLLPLDRLDLLRRQDVAVEMFTDPSRDERPGLGELQLALAHLPSAGRLTVTMLQARDLPLGDPKKSPEWQVKVTVLGADGQRLKKRKTTTRRGEAPVFNEALTFELDGAALQGAAVEVSVGAVGESVALGRLVLGPASRGPTGHQRRLLLSRGRAPPAWHLLVR